VGRGDHSLTERDPSVDYTGDGARDRLNSWLAK